MGQSPKFGLTTLPGALAGAEIFLNENSLMLENGASALSVIDRGLTTAPGSPSDGDVYILAGTGGAWGTETNKTPATGDVAIYYNGWIYFTPQSGQIAYIEDEKLWLAYSQSAWHLHGDAWPTTKTWTGRYHGTKKLYRKLLDCGLDQGPGAWTVAHGMGWDPADGPAYIDVYCCSNTSGFPAAFPMSGLLTLGSGGVMYAGWELSIFDNTNLLLETSFPGGIYRIYARLEWADT